MAEPWQDRAPYHDITALTAEIIGVRSSPLERSQARLPRSNGSFADPAADAEKRQVSVHS
jgi:hypothetical protein